MKKDVNWTGNVQGGELKKEEEAKPIKRAKQNSEDKE